jgi:thiamine pyrophosphokinase
LSKCIILANGKAPKKEVISYLMKIGYNILICADGGANSAYKMGLIPDFIIGDLDSINKSVYEFYKDKSSIKKITRQNDTDVEKCLKFAISRKVKDAVLTGVTGDRLDHTFCNLGIVVKFFHNIKLRIVAENSILQPFTGNNEIKTIPGETVSVYGLDPGTKIYSKGLKYKLNNISLPFGKKESTSNISLGNKVNLNVKGGIVFVIRDYMIMKNNGLIQSS